jgi:hypothetical protein
MGYPTKITRVVRPMAVFKAVFQSQIGMPGAQDDGTNVERDANSPICPNPMKPQVAFRRKVKENALPETSSEQHLDVEARSLRRGETKAKGAVIACAYHTGEWRGEEAEEDT